MHKSLTYSYISLLLLTISVAVLASTKATKIIIALIVFFSIIKFLLVAFQFMELKKAHGFWKFLIVFFGSILGAVFMLFL